MSYIKLENIHKIYMEGQENEVRALDGVNLEIEQGQFLAIVGASGSGKSTMMNILGCLDVPTYGNYRLNGIPVEEMSPKKLSQIRSHEIGFIFQGYNLIPSLSVLDNVALPLSYQGISKKERHERARKALALVEVEEKAENKPSQLSGGQQQRVAIARAICTESPVLMADEPTGALDSKTGAAVLEIFKNLTDKTIILITHDLSIAAHASRVVTMKDGKLVSDTVGHEVQQVHAGGAVLGGENG
ncbi:MAG: ABC transporter ATP-binding protein [Eubacteriales bacterium]